MNNENEEEYERKIEELEEELEESKKKEEKDSAEKWSLSEIVFVLIAGLFLIAGIGKFLGDCIDWLITKSIPTLLSHPVKPAIIFGGWLIIGLIYFFLRRRK